MIIYYGFVLYTIFKTLEFCLLIYILFIPTYKNYVKSINCFLNLDFLTAVLSLDVHKSNKKELYI